MTTTLFYITALVGVSLLVFSIVSNLSSER